MNEAEALGHVSVVTIGGAVSLMFPVMFPVVAFFVIAKAKKH